jgi:hypothetical protein
MHDDDRPGTAGASSTGGFTTPPLSEMAATAAAGIKAETAGVADAAQRRAVGFADEQKHAGAKQAETLARAIHRGAEEIKGTSPKVAEYAHEAASSIANLAETFRARGFKELLQDAEALGRRQPVAFFAVAVFAGFAAVRFAKSSAGAATRDSQVDSNAGGRQTYSPVSAAPHASVGTPNPAV